MKKLKITIDVEPDLHSQGFKSITQGLKTAEKLFDKYNVKPILFVTCDVLNKFPNYFKKLEKKGWEISSHGYDHKRFDDLSYKEKKQQIKKILQCFKKINLVPRGFRAPQHSIDNETLDLLEAYEFQYDSSYAPCNLLQLFFFPSRFKLWLKQFFSPLNPYKIRKNLIERPTSAFIIPFVALPLRMSWLLTYLLYKILKLSRKEIIFYCHSWDFIALPQSKIDKYFPFTNFIKNLEKLIKLDKEKND